MVKFNYLTRKYYCMRSYLHRTIYTIILLTLALSCTKNPLRLPPSADLCMVDSLIECYSDSLYSPSKHVIGILEDHRDNCSDSVAINVLDLEISKYYFFSSDFNKALSVAHSAKQSIKRRLVLEQDSASLKLHATACNLLAVCFSQISRRDKAIDYLQVAAKDSRKSGNLKDLPNIYINLADNYQALGNFPRTSDYYHQALAVCDSIGDNSSMRYAVLSGLAKLYMDLSNFSKSDHFFTQAEKMKFERNPQELFYFLNSRGNYFYNLKDYHAALETFTEARKVAEQTGFDINIATADGNLAEIYILLDSLPQARKRLDAAKEGFKESYYSSSTRFYIDGLYTSLVMREGDMNRAKTYLANAVVPDDNPQYLYYHHGRMARYHLLRGDKDNFIKYYNATEKYRDSMQNAKIRSSIAESEIRYQRDTMLLHKDIELSQSKLESDKWKMAALLTALLLIATIAIMVILAVHRRRHHEIDYHRQLNTITSLRMETIRNRLSPHYIFNVLNMILPAFTPHKDIEEPLKKLIQVLRGALILGENMASSLADERQWLDNFIGLRLLGHNQPIRVVWNVDEDVDTEQLIPSLAIQIPVSNALKHAFNDGNAIKDPIVVVNVAYNDSRALVVDIRDNGSGYNDSEESPSRGTGNGLKILNQTIEVLNANNNKNRITLDIANIKHLNPSQSGTSVKITIPQNYNFDI